MLLNAQIPYEVFDYIRLVTMTGLSRFVTDEKYRINRLHKLGHSCKFIAAAINADRTEKTRRCSESGVRKFIKRQGRLVQHIPRKTGKKKPPHPRSAAVYLRGSQEGYTNQWYRVEEENW